MNGMTTNHEHQKRQHIAHLSDGYAPGPRLPRRRTTSIGTQLLTTMCAVCALSFVLLMTMLMVALLH